MTDVVREALLAHLNALDAKEAEEKALKSKSKHNKAGVYTPEVVQHAWGTPSGMQKQREEEGPPPETKPELDLRSVFKMESPISVVPSLNLPPLPMLPTKVERKVSKDPAVKNGTANVSNASQATTPPSSPTIDVKQRFVRYAEYIEAASDDADKKRRLERVMKDILRHTASSAEAKAAAEAFDKFMDEREKDDFVEEPDDVDFGDEKK